MNSEPEYEFGLGMKSSRKPQKSEINNASCRNRSEMMTRKEKEVAERKAHILNIAEKLFAQKGLQNTSVADIAQAAEFGIGTLYKYFTDKNTLIASLLEERLMEHYDGLEAAISSPMSPPEAVERLIQAFLSSIKRRSDFFRIYFTVFHPALETTAFFPGLEQLEQRKRELFSRVDDIYRQGIDQGHFIDVENEEYLTATTWGVLMSFYFLAQKRFNGAIHVEKMTRIIQRLLFEQVRLTA